MKKTKMSLLHYSKTRKKGHAFVLGGLRPPKQQRAGNKKKQKSFNFYIYKKPVGKREFGFKRSGAVFNSKHSVQKNTNSIYLRGNLSKKNRSLLCMRAQSPKAQKAGKQTVNNQKKNVYNRYGQKHFFGEIGRKVSHSKRPFLQIPVNNKISIYKEYKLFYKQKVWYRDKAAGLPGANIKFITAFVQKNKFYKKIQSAYKIFKNYYSLSKKSLQKLYKKRNKNLYENSMEYSVLIQLDSLYSSSMCKSGLVQNKHEKDIFKNYYSNGQSVYKKNFFLDKRTKAIHKDGDFCIGIQG